ACVHSSENALAAIRSSYPRTLNLGVSGAGPLFDLAVFREYVEPLQPEVTLWLYFSGNDADDLSYEARDPVLLRYLERRYSQHLFTAPRNEIDGRLAALIDREIADPVNRFARRDVGGGREVLRAWASLRDLRNLLRARAPGRPAQLDSALLGRVLET